MFINIYLLSLLISVYSAFILYDYSSFEYFRVRVCSGRVAFHSFSVKGLECQFEIDSVLMLPKASVVV